MAHVLQQYYKRSDEGNIVVESVEEVLRYKAKGGLYGSD